MTTAVNWDNIAVEDIPAVTDTMPLPPDNEPIVDYPDPSFIKSAPKPRTAAKYQAKAASILSVALRFTAAQDTTVADAAAIIQYGEAVAEKAGILAVRDERVARALDWIDGGTENPYVSLAIVALPLVLQVARNHEPQLEPAPRGFRIPFLKDKEGMPRRVRIPFKVGVRLGGLRAATNDPRDFTKHVFDNPAVRAKMVKEKIHVSYYGE